VARSRMQLFAQINELRPLFFLVYRVAISDNRIVACTDDSVTYRYRPSGTRQWKLRTVTGHDFVKGFAQHILPAGFRKVRYYGWWAANSRTTLDRVKWLVWLWRGWTWWLGSGVAPPREQFTPAVPRCADCGGDLTLVRVIDHHGRILHTGTLLEHTTSYLDSG